VQLVQRQRTRGGTDDGRASPLRASFIVFVRNEHGGLPHFCHPQEHELTENLHCCAAKKSNCGDRLHKAGMQAIQASTHTIRPHSGAGDPEN